MPEASSPRRLTIGLLVVTGLALTLGRSDGLTFAAQPPVPLVIVHTQPPYADPISLHAVACPTAALCVAVDDAGNVLTSGGPGPNPWHVTDVDGDVNMTAVSCATTRLCVATDEGGDVVVSTAPTHGARAWRVSHVDNAVNGLTAFYPSNYLTSVSCPTTAFCVATDNRGNIVSSTDPAGASAHWTTANVDGTNTFASVSCASASFCAAVDLAGNLIVSSHPTGGAGTWRVEPLPGAELSAPFPAGLSGNFLSAISCPSEGLCVVTTSAGDILSSQQPGRSFSTWSFARVDDSAGLNSVSCAGVYCAAVDAHGDTLTTTSPRGGPGAWQTAVADRSRESIAGVSCPAAEECAAVDLSGNGLELVGAASWRLQPRIDEPRSSPCFGAAQHGLGGQVCRGTAHVYTVLPTPDEAEITPNAPCAVVADFEFAEICTFGVPASAAKATVALLGDSHAQHWRAALDVVAQAKGWQGVSITQAGCPFFDGPLSIGGQRFVRCREMMMHDVIRWLRSQPEIRTVFVSESELSVPHARDDLGEDVRGYRRAWAALPASVRHIVVIRDTPRLNGRALGCVEAALAAHRRFPGRACAVRRSAALGADPATIAALEAHHARLQVINMTPFFCDTRLCYPVVGGALVYKDFQHLTEVFSTTLGPFLGKDIARLAAGWDE